MGSHSFFTLSPFRLSSVRRPEGPIRVWRSELDPEQTFVAFQDPYNEASGLDEACEYLRFPRLTDGGATRFEWAAYKGVKVDFDFTVDPTRVLGAASSTDGTISKR